MAKTDDAPAAGEQPPAGGELDDAKLGGMIESAVRKVFAERTAAPPTQPTPGPVPGSAAAPAGGGATPSGPGGGDTAGGVAAMIESAVAKALGERDREDALAVLADEIDRVKAAVLTRPERRRGWGAYLLGPGLTR